MKELWDINYEAICADWDDIYQLKYMEYAAENGLSDDVHLDGVAMAYEYACRTIMEKYPIKFNDLDSVLAQHSQVIGKSKKTRK